MKDSKGIKFLLSMIVALNLMILILMGKPLIAIAGGIIVCYIEMASLSFKIDSIQSVFLNTLTKVLEQYEKSN